MQKRMILLLFSIILFLIPNQPYSLAGESAYLVTVTGELTYVSPEMVESNPDIKVGTSFEITYDFESYPDTNFEMGTEREYQQDANVFVKLGSDNTFEGQPGPVKIFINNDDDFYADTFEIEGEGQGNLSGVGGELYQVEFKIVDETKSMLGSLNLPTDGSFFNKSTESDTIFGFVGGNQAIGKVLSLSINGTTEPDTTIKENDEQNPEPEDNTQNTNNQVDSENKEECEQGEVLKDGVCTIIFDELENNVDLEIFAVVDQFDHFADNPMLDAVVYTEFVTIVNLGDETAKNVRVTGDLTTPNSEFFGVDQFDGDPMYYKVLDMFGAETIFSENPPEGMITMSDCSFSSQKLNILCYLGDLGPHEEVTLYPGVIVYEPLGKTIGRIYEVKSDSDEIRFDNNVWREDNSPTITGGSWFVETYFAQQDCPECTKEKENFEESGVSYAPPDWFKTNAMWFSEDLIGMDEMINAITNLFEQNIIPLPSLPDQKPEVSNENEPTIPEYTKTVFQFWGSGQVSDEEIGNHIRYLVEIGVINSPKIQRLQEQSTYPTIMNFNNWDLALKSNLEKKNGLKQLLVIKNYEGILFGENSDYLWNEYSETKDKTTMQMAQESDSLEKQAKEDAKIIVDTIKDVDKSVEVIKNIPDIDHVKFDNLQNEYASSEPKSIDATNQISTEEALSRLEELYINPPSYNAMVGYEEQKIMLDAIDVSVQDWEPTLEIHTVLSNGLEIKIPKEDIQKALSNNKGELHQYFQPKFSGFTVGHSDTPKISIVVDPKLKEPYSFIGYNFDKEDFAANLVIVVPTETNSEENWHIDINLGRVENGLLNPKFNLLVDETKNLSTIMDEIEKTLIIN